MPVFISHRQIDDDIAKKVYQRLNGIHGIKCFIDDFTSGVAPDQVTKVITSALQSCTHLLAVVTENTRESWWVPFEIGYATHCERAISSFTNLQKPRLPEYLWSWPILMDDYALDRFAAIYKSEMPYLNTFLNASNEKVSALSSRVYSFSHQFSPKGFESKLKSTLGQG